MVYGYPTDVHTVFDLMNYNNSITSNLFGNMLVLAFWAVLFTSFKLSTPVEKSVMVASAISAIFALFLSIPGIVPGYSVVILIAVTVGSLVLDRPR